MSTEHYEAIQTWLEAGAPLESFIAVAALGAILRFFLVPLVESTLNRFWGIELFSTWKLQVINGCGVALALIVGFLTSSETELTMQILIGIMSAQVAIGFHQTTHKAREASANSNAFKTIMESVPDPDTLPPAETVELVN